MASVVGAGLFNAIAFAGAGFAFSAIGGDDYSIETERHNRAVEKLAADKEVFLEKKTQLHDRISKLRVELANANADMNDTNDALDNVRAVLRLVADRKKELTKAEDDLKECDPLFLVTTTGQVKK